jgi:hypothetical protein
MNRLRPSIASAGLILASTLVALVASSCVEQTLSIDSNPPGALVFLNDQEVGRTPIHRDFEWHGDYDVQVRKDGYQTLRTHAIVVAPWWNWMPFDLVCDLLPYHYHELQKLNFTLDPMPPEPKDPSLLLARSEELRAQLESSPHTLKPTTHPATMPTTKPTAKTVSTATQPSQATTQP